MKEEEQIIEGKIISNQLGKFGKEEMLYGYIGIEITPKQHVAIKIDSYTWYETLEVGNHVIVEAVKLGVTDILVARKVSLSQGANSSSQADAVIAS
jgi:hypothetical protein